MFVKTFQNTLLRYLVRKMARAQGFADPINLLSAINRFAQPSEITVPTELLRAGALFQARGLINTQAIQHNLDWVWPYWVEHQFDPQDKAFIPRAFQLTHINLTNRNWTAIGSPHSIELPIVDPRGLITPFWDGWSLDIWFFPNDGIPIYPSQINDVKQNLSLNGNLAVITQCWKNDSRISSEAYVDEENETLSCLIKASVSSIKPGWLIVSLRPFNPEGVSFIHEIEKLPENKGWNINNSKKVYFDPVPDEYQFSRYQEGDIAQNIFQNDARFRVNCNVGMATAAALFNTEPTQKRQIIVRIPLEKKFKDRQPRINSNSSWNDILRQESQISIPDEKYKNLYDNSLATVLLHSVNETYAGPYTYKRFWFRDACFITHALMCAGYLKKAESIIETFPKRQTATGYFKSQDGEWDSNGQVLWVLKRFFQLTHQKPSEEWQKIIQKGAKWIMHKRLKHIDNCLHSGLMPAGFSAEHLGPSDFYYWDNFWSIGGLNAAAYLMELVNEKELASKFKNDSDDLLKSLTQNLQQVRKRIKRKAIPASPYRRLDSGAIGSLAANYPLQLWDSNDPCIKDTVDYLIENCLVSNGFFHDMSHSGINPYLTLHIAQILMRCGDSDFLKLIKAVADLASPTGMWPEAIHPQTKGGCMGDGQHVWAAAEWILMMRNSFVFEEEKDSRLILFAGIPSSWYQEKGEISFGPAPTSYGPIQVGIKSDGNNLFVSWKGDWFDQEPHIYVNLPDSLPVKTKRGATCATIPIKNKKQDGE